MSERDFETDLRAALGPDIQADDSVAREAYAALCNVDWTNDDGTQFGCSWRYAGAVVNSIVHPDDEDPMGYCNFYCSGDEGAVSERVADALSGYGWRYKQL